MAAVEDRDRKKIDQSDTYRNERRQLEKVEPAYRGYVTRKLGNSDYPTELARFSSSRENVPQLSKGGGHDGPGLATSFAKSREEAISDMFPLASRRKIQAQQANFLRATRNTYGGQSRGGAEKQVPGAAADLNRKRLARLVPNKGPNVGERIYRRAIHPEDGVALLKACHGRGT